MTHSQRDPASDITSEHTLPTLQTPKQWRNIPSSLFSSKKQNIPSQGDLARLHAAAPSGDGCCIEPPCTALGAWQELGCLQEHGFSSPPQQELGELAPDTGKLIHFVPSKSSGRLSSSWCFLPSCMVSWAVGRWHTVVQEMDCEEGTDLLVLFLSSRTAGSMQRLQRQNKAQGNAIGITGELQDKQRIGTPSNLPL